MPKILICDGPAAKRPGSKRRASSDRRGSMDRRRSSDPFGDKKVSMQSPCGTLPTIAKCLSESYDMQEKLAQDNVDLEGKR